jgi:hypothetical protein
MTLLSVASRGPRNGCYGDTRQLADLSACLPPVQQVSRFADGLAGSGLPGSADRPDVPERPGSWRTRLRHGRPAHVGRARISRARAASTSSPAVSGGSGLRGTSPGTNDSISRPCSSVPSVSRWTPAADPAAAPGRNPGRRSVRLGAGSVRGAAHLPCLHLVVKPRIGLFKTFRLRNAPHSAAVVRGLKYPWPRELHRSAAQPAHHQEAASSARALLRY